MTKILHLDSSGQTTGSASRTLSAEIVKRLCDKHPDAQVIRREAAENADFPDAVWVAANFTLPDDRTEEQNHRLQHSQTVVEEVQAADYIVIGSPIYNFTISGALKAWIDQISRPGLTFRAEPSGFVGLLENKKVYLVISSGGTKVNGPIDFATGYMIHVLGFLGITDVSVIAADTMIDDPEGALRRAREQIEELIHDRPADEPMRRRA